jgi:hypothetical protein
MGGSAGRDGAFAGAGAERPVDGSPGVPGPSGPASGSGAGSQSEMLSVPSGRCTIRMTGRASVSDVISRARQSTWTENASMVAKSRVPPGSLRAAWRTMSENGKRV